MDVIFADSTFKCKFLKGNWCFLIQISVKLVFKAPVYNKLTMVQVMAWCHHARHCSDKGLNSQDTSYKALWVPSIVRNWEIIDHVITALHGTLPLTSFLLSLALFFSSCTAVCSFSTWAAKSVQRRSFRTNSSWTWLLISTTEDSRWAKVASRTCVCSCKASWVFITPEMVQYDVMIWIHFLYF